MRITDTCARYGLDKIMAVLPNTSLQQAKMTCAKLDGDTKIREILEVNPQRGFCLSVTAGVAEAQKGSALEEILNNVRSNQNALYKFNVR